MASKLYLIFCISMVLKNVFSLSNCTDSKVDIIFVVDSSDNISNEDFRNELVFVTNFVLGTRNIGRQGKQIGIQIFASHTKANFDLGTYENQIDIVTAITQIQRLHGISNTHLALEEVKKNGFSPARGSRALVHKVVILISDGHAADLLRTKAAANELMQNNVNIFTIGIGKNVDPKLFLDIASSAKNIFVSEKFDAFNNIQQRLREITCSTCTVIPTDVIFALDTSRSITESEFQQMLNVVSEFVLQTAIFGETGTQVGVYTFSDCPRLELPLGIDNEKFAFNHALLSLKLVKGQTNTNLVLDAVRKKGFTVAFGARKNAKSILIVITDNVSSNPYTTRVAAAKLHEMKINVFSIGVSNSVDMTELHNMASSPQNVLFTPTFDSLRKFSSILNKLVCLKTK